MEHISATAPALVNTISAAEMKISVGGVTPIMTPAAFQVENISSYINGQGSMNSSSDEDEASLHEKESNPSQSDAGVAC